MPTYKHLLFLPLLIIFGCTHQPVQQTAEIVTTAQPPPIISPSVTPQIKKPSSVKHTIEEQKSFNESGQLIHIISYKNGVKINKKTFVYYQTGELSIRTTYIDDLKEGIVEYYSKNGDIWRTEQYLHGKKHGPTISYYAPHIIAKKQQFQFGQLDGIQQAFLRNGQCTDKWIYQQGELISHFKFKYFDNGKLALQQSYRDDKQNGISKRYDESGRLLSAIQYEDDLLHGKYLQFYPNGKIEIEKQYRNNLLHGGSSGYFPDGALQWQSYYINGQREGLYQEYYPNGQLKKRVHYQQDLQNGMKQFYHENGYLKYELTMKNSKAEGLLKEYDAQGQLTLSQHYSNGKISEKTGNFLNGYLNWLSENDIEKLIN